MSDAVRYHINPETGNANQCKAKYIENCKFSDGGRKNVQHYDTKEEAKKGYEITMESYSINVDKTYKRVAKNISQGVYSQDDVTDYILEKVLEDRAQWTDDEKQNFLILDRVSNILRKEHVSDEEFAEVDSLIKIQRPTKRRPYSAYDQNAPVHRDKYLSELPKVLKIRKQWQQEEHNLVIPRDTSDIKEVFHNTSELDKAAKSWVDDYSIYGETQQGDSKHVDDALNRMATGEEFVSKNVYGDDLNMGVDWELSYMKPEQKIFTLLGKNENGYPNNQAAYLALAFPQNELKDALKADGVKNVQVDSFVNGREVGNVYTVYQPDGNTRSFSVYEHRNSDSIIINGLTNWDKDRDGLPYAVDSRHQYFAEISVGETERAARTLSYFMKEAQKGELEDDQTLIKKAEHIDWTTRLSEKIPGFKQWADEKGLGKKETNDPRILGK